MLYICVCIYIDITYLYYIYIYTYNIYIIYIIYIYIHTHTHIHIYTKVPTAAVLYALVAVKMISTLSLMGIFFFIYFFYCLSIVVTALYALAEHITRRGVENTLIKRRRRELLSLLRYTPLPRW